MNHGRERELKYRIGSREDFLSLRDAPDWGERGAVLAQLNYYFDTADLTLARSRAMLRIRTAGDCVLTLKCGVEARPGYFDSLELEAEISEGSIAALLQKPATLLDLLLPPIEELKRRFGRLEVSLLGRLHNERVRRTIDGLVLEVDRVTFPDGSELFELEIETDEILRAEAWVDSRLISHGLRLAPQRLTKLEELLKRQGSDLAFGRSS